MPSWQRAFLKGVADTPAAATAWWLERQARAETSSRVTTTELGGVRLNLSTGRMVRPDLKSFGQLDAFDALALADFKVGPPLAGWQSF